MKVILDLFLAGFVFLGILGGFMYFVESVFKATPKWIRIIKRIRRRFSK